MYFACASSFITNTYIDNILINIRSLEHHFIHAVFFLSQM